MNVSIKQRIEQQVGLIDSIHPLAEQGGTAIVYYVKTLGGTYILKQASLPRYREWLAQEATVMQTFKSQHIIIPTYIDYIEDTQQDYLLMSYIAGETLTAALADASELQRLELIRAFGRFLRQLHTSGISSTQSSKDWLDKQLLQANHYIEQGWTNGSRELLNALSIKQPEHVPATWIHGDCTTDNLLVRDNAIVAFIDVAGMTVGDPRYDEALATRSFREDIKMLDAFYSGYGFSPISEETFRYFDDGLYEFY
ncbi:phosphotransferase [Exiguobacterium oxidotolerans]|uniref:Amino acid transporter n=1 Tax=Exiguobacterium oxidotolerans TaxID=223958 RepID=A0A653IHC5_9BACL|nr:phosphotransferase [Exiguobacterium oxidotolerans]VWX38630.1 Amino acid transporter [Exiguobacterium oxidotolerans]